MAGARRGATAISERDLMAVCAFVQLPQVENGKPCRMNQLVAANAPIFFDMQMVCKMTKHFQL